MTVSPSHPPITPQPAPSLFRSAVWVAIGALIAAAIVCVVWVLIGPQNGLIGRAFLTILLLAAFAGVAIFDAQVAPRRPAWYVLASMGGWVLILLTGAFKIWLPFLDEGWAIWDNSFSRFMQFITIAIVVRLALLHIALFVKASQKRPAPFTTGIMWVTVVLVVVLAIMLVIPLTFPDQFFYPEMYWRVVVAVTILAAVGTALVPLINALNSPRAQQVAAAPALAPWPMYVDGITPLPMLPDGTPDWNAYYTGYPSPGAQVIQPVQQAPTVPPVPVAPQAAPSVPMAPVAPGAGYEGYPAPPPLPPQR